MYLFELQFCLDTCPGVGLLDHKVVLFLIFLVTSIMVTHSGCTILHPHQHCTRISISPHLHHHLLSLIFLIIAIITGVGQQLIVVLICIFLMISDVQHLFIYLLVICMSSLEKCVFKLKLIKLCTLNMHRFFCISIVPQYNCKKF